MATARKLIQTTPVVAKVLSGDFRIRSGYEVINVDTRIEPWPETPPITIRGSTEAAVALRRLFAKQNDIAGRRVVMPTNIEIGDIVEARQESGTALLLITGLSSSSVTGYALVRGTATMLHDVLDSREVFATAHKLTVRRAISSKIDVNTVLLRYSWNAKRPAFIGLNEWLSHLDSNSPAVHYHEGDFVMLQPRDGSLLDVVQVHRVRNQDVLIRRLHRQILTASPFKNDRLLVPDTQIERVARARFAPASRCYVSLQTSASSSWTSEDFLVAKKDVNKLSDECAPCTAEHRLERRKLRGKLPLKAMELMCGAGGLSIGLDLSGACETKVAIDSDSDSVRTFKMHHPNADVHCEDAGDALRRAIQGRVSPEGLTYPLPGQIDVISAGPPCQGFSRKNRTANREAAEKDSRNLLALTVLGWVEHLRPKYVVLENVEGFTQSKLRGRDQGMVKLALKSLLELGYAATCGFVQSGSFGCPQKRGRFVLLGAQRELILPQMPRASHRLLGPQGHRFTWTDGFSRTYVARSEGLAALLPAVTVADATDDLPVFEDPHEVYAGPDDVEIERERLGIPQLPVSPGKAVGFVKAAYVKRPSNSYQERMRVFTGQSVVKVTQHQTSGTVASAVERVVNVALRPGADFESWNQCDVRKPALLGGLQNNRWQDQHFRFERIDGDKYFKTLLTSASVQGSMIHPDQRRLFTVRECARAQGFPDWIEFHTDPNLASAYRQIGNAVPVPLAVALGKSLMAARLRDSETEE
ncbi:Polynucleotide adenylyltransferase [Pseudozyma hubeiensis]|nr:Polynucleotide adenylyltransferase [Pseudozyma hubeiensis]